MDGRPHLLRFTLVLVLLALAAHAHPQPKLGANLTQDGVWSSGGAISGGSAPGELDLVGQLPGDVIGGREDDELEASIIANWGGSPSRHVGDLQRTSNVETAAQFKLYELWYQFQLNSRWDLRAGLMNYNEEAYSLASAQLFLNSSFGIGPELSQVTLPNFPVAAPGARLRWQRENGWYVFGGVFDGVAGNPNHPNQTAFHINAQDGVFSAAEAGWSDPAGAPRKLAVGIWWHTHQFTGPDRRLHNRNIGGYLIGERPLSRRGWWRHVAVFAMAGLAEGDRNVIDGYWSAGVNARGLLPWRPHDRLGLAIASARLSPAYRRTLAAPRAAETTIELSYAVHLLPWLILQPDLQRVLSPSGDGTRSDATVATLRGILHY